MSSELHETVTGISWHVLYHLGMKKWKHAARYNMSVSLTRHKNPINASLKLVDKIQVPCRRAVRENVEKTVLVHSVYKYQSLICAHSYKCYTLWTIGLLLTWMTTTATCYLKRTFSKGMTNLESISIELKQTVRMVIDKNSSFTQKGFNSSIYWSQEQEYTYILTLV